MTTPTIDPTPEPSGSEIPKGEFRQCRPNPSWPDEIRYLIRFYVAAPGEKLPPCPICQSKKRGRWTMLCPFKTFSMGAVMVEPAGEFPPLTLVCSEHMIAPIDTIQNAL